jgi:serine phosphatase RsbU (regulator of sigma subunit)
MEAVRRLVELSHRARPEDLPAALLAVAPLLDARLVAFYLVDYEQTTLRPLRSGRRTDTPSVPVDGTPAGEAFSTVRPVTDHDGLDHHLWLPLLNGAERLGVLHVVSAEPLGRRAVRDLHAVAAVVAELVASRRRYGDAVEHTRRRLPMQLAAEIIWNQLPPLTFATHDTVVTAVLEPCYDVGGDAFDYAVNDDVLHVAMFDTVGHGISASALTTLAVNCYRNARRCGLGLADTYASIDKWIRAQYQGSFVTAIMAELNTTTGDYRRICAGHPPELLLRGGRLLRQLDGPTALPLGLASMRSRPPVVAAESLAPGDSILIFTDGVIEARDSDGDFFGVDRLTELITTELAVQAPAAETMRRMVHAILHHQHDELQDDATAALLQWRPAAQSAPVPGPRAIPSTTVGSAGWSGRTVDGAAFR